MRLPFVLFRPAPSRAVRWWLIGLLAGSLFLARVMAEQETPATAPAAPDQFSSLVKLAPFVVSGKSLAISIYARTRSDRRYGEEFAQEVVRVVYEAVTESTGRGLVIIGAKGEPHPIFVFRKFLALAKDGKLDPAIAARAPELAAMVDEWQHALSEGRSEGGKNHDGPDLDFEKIFTALPLPLAGIGARLYQLAWEEKFDDARVEAKLCALRAGDLEQRDRFKSFEWVFYLPPQGAFDRVLDDVIADALKQEDVGFFGRIAVKGVLLVVKPKIRRAIEAMRQGMMFMTVLEAQTSYRKEETAALAGAYVDVFLPFEAKEKPPPGANDHERAVAAVRAELQKLAAKPKPTAAPAVADATAPNE